MHGSDTTIERFWDRRESLRARCCGERLRWRAEGARRAQRGWLNDVSISGLSFLIERDREPHAGEIVEVITDPRADAIECTVIRVTGEGSDLSLVACERAAAPAEIPAMAA